VLVAAKVTIRKTSDSRWTVTYSGYGFHGATSTSHTSGAAAISALNQRRVSGGSYGITEQSYRHWSGGTARANSAGQVPSERADHPLISAAHQRPG
jgi:hypothetical protein